MPSPSRDGGPAALPKYLRIAAALRQELEDAAHGPGGRLPSERTLAAHYRVNRQTVRAALQHLREDGLIVTERRGTRSAFPAPPAAPAPPAPPAAPAPSAAPGPSARYGAARAHGAYGDDGVGGAVATRPPEVMHGGVPAAGPAGAPGAVVAQSWLARVIVPPPLAPLLGMRSGERTLVHHRRERSPAGQTLQHAVTYLCPRAVAQTPDLAVYRDRPAARDEDLGPLHRWLDRAAEQGRVADTITLTRSSHPRAAAPACGLTVRRTLHDDSGRLLAVTDLAFPTWDRLTFHRDRATGGFRVS
ncbi:GntR family transcriptional regulator [Streptomyces sp. NPDC127106]|uniref:GntR family transcriptional regulator n=1 Tax=Streptomyces sp. NPDC127106 TaxID=3345360 RepID=UPI00362E0DC8